jgi:hypothetical protein
VIGARGPLRPLSPLRLLFVHFCATFEDEDDDEDEDEGEDDALPRQFPAFLRAEFLARNGSIARSL